MLPDLRIVIAAVVSTFILTVGVGFFASSRVLHEQMTARLDSKAMENTPINRIALNWPEPTKFEPSVNLDLAVSTKGPRNPVRDVTVETAAKEAAQALSAPSIALAKVADSPQQSTDMQSEIRQSPEIAVMPEPAEGTQSAASSDIDENNTEAEKDAHENAAAEHPQDSLAAKAPSIMTDEPAQIESTSSISTPAPTTPLAPEPAMQAQDTAPQQEADQKQDVPQKQDSPQQLAARPNPEDSKAATVHRPILGEPSSSIVIRKKRHVRRAPTAKSRPVVTQHQVVQPQPFPLDFFGLFRVPSAPLRQPARPHVPQALPSPSS